MCKLSRFLQHLIHCVCQKPEKRFIALVKESCPQAGCVFQYCKNFRELKQTLAESVNDIKANFTIMIAGSIFIIVTVVIFQAEIKIAGDVLVFYMHTNVFQFDKSHSVWRSSYLKDNDDNSYVGIINVYNFLADSFKYQRISDMGYLIARIFVNREGHFLVQGKRQLGYLYNDFVNNVLDKEALKSIVDSCVLYTLDFDLYTPPYENLQQVTVEEIQSITSSSSLATGKRMGFRFGLEDTGF
jgi:hypothetical protein